MNAEQEIIGIIGLGYVGMPLAMAFAGQFEVIGLDISQRRVEQLLEGYDSTGEFGPDELKAAHPHLRLTTSPEALRTCSFLIVTVPTPLDDACAPDVSALKEASLMLGRILRKGMMVVYESTVYPGLTEEVCLPLLEQTSGLKLGDFALGYSPERVNPGDKERPLADITKVVSGHDEAALRRAEQVYGRIIRAGVHPAPSIKTAEAAKVIENVQRDLNIALMNELSKIFTRMGLDTDAVLAAASTKWNFHRYHPGLVGGHCIGVDPYYLTHRAIQLGYHPEVILAGRRINDSMGAYVAETTVRALTRSGRLPQEARVLIMGLTFKENVPDCRNSKAFDVVRVLKEYGASILVCEPLLDPGDIAERFDLEAVAYEDADQLDAVVLINKHDAFLDVRLEDLRERMRTPVLVDIKNRFDRATACRLGFLYACL